jgi:hypothetical protein
LSDLTFWSFEPLELLPPVDIECIYFIALVTGCQPRGSDSLVSYLGTAIARFGVSMVDIPTSSSRIRAHACPIPELQPVSTMKVSTGLFKRPKPLSPAVGILDLFRSKCQVPSQIMNRAQIASPGISMNEHALAMRSPCLTREWRWVSWPRAPSNRPAPHLEPQIPPLYKTAQPTPR